MVSNFNRYSCIPGMLLFGTATVTIQKFVLDFSAEGITDDGTPEVHKFNKPWFQTEAMFVGMFLCLIVFEISYLIEKFTKKSKTEEPLIQPEEEKKQKNHWVSYIYVGAPALCDLCATCLMNIGLFYIAASIWQMLRGSMVIFSALISIIFLKKKYHAYQWASIASVCVGLVIVALASIIKFDDDPTVAPTGEPSLGDSQDATTGDIILAIFLVVFAQIIQASQIVIEEYLLKNVHAPASLIVGLEGLWGGLVGALILTGIYFTPTDNAFVAKLFHENTIDSFIMIGHDNALLTLLIFYVFCILAYNLFGMMVTETYSAVYRTIIEAVRTLCIWIVNIIIYYAYALPTNHLNFGEKIGWNSLIEAIGFACIMLGTFTFNRVIKFKFFKYEDETPAQPEHDVENPEASAPAPAPAPAPASEEAK